MPKAPVNGEVAPKADSHAVQPMGFEVERTFECGRFPHYQNRIILEGVYSKETPSTGINTAPCGYDHVNVAATTHELVLATAALSGIDLHFVVASAGLAGATWRRADGSKLSPAEPDATSFPKSYRTIKNP